MVRQDIVIALKNAVDRGDSLEKAMQVLLNSGYNQNEVIEAVSYLTGGAYSPSNIQQYIQVKQPIQQYPPKQHQSQLSQQSITSQQTSQQVPQFPNQSQSQNIPYQNSPYQTPQIASSQLQNIPQIQQLPIQSQEKQKKKFPGAVFILLGILLFLIVVLVLTLLFKDQTIEFIKKLIGS